MYIYMYRMHTCFKIHFSILIVLILLILRLDDELVLRRSLSEYWSIGNCDDLKGSRRRTFGSVRKSFFRRRRHQNISKDSQEFASFSDASLNCESVPTFKGICCVFCCTVYPHQFAVHRSRPHILADIALKVFFKAIS